MSDYDEADYDQDDYVIEIECPYCDGTGETMLDVNLMTDCPECGGTGWC